MACRKDCKVTDDHNTRTVKKSRISLNNYMMPSVTCESVMPSKMGSLSVYPILNLLDSTDKSMADVLQIVSTILTV